jgi:CheY-like chemotaxis protein
MWLESIPGQGSTFFFTVRPESVPVSPRRFVSSERPRLTGKRLLVVDDNLTSQRILTTLADKWQMLVVVFSCGSEALTLLKEGKQHFDLAVLDVQMPEMDGLEATRRIKADCAGQQAPWIIALTANAMEGDREMCLQARMDDYLGKPIKSGELAAALARAATRSRADF